MDNLFIPSLGIHPIRDLLGPPTPLEIGNGIGSTCHDWPQNGNDSYGRLDAVRWSQENTMFDKMLCL